MNRNPSNIFEDAEPIMNANARMTEDKERNRAKGSYPS
jgi:hypothetical protein